MARAVGQRVIHETPTEFRTRDRHWRFYPQHGIIRCFRLKNDPTGFQLVIGSLDFELDFRKLQDRPDLLQYLGKFVEVWVNAGKREASQG